MSKLNHNFGYKFSSNLSLRRIRIAQQKHLSVSFASLWVFFYQGILSRTTHRTAGEGKGPYFIPLYHFHSLTNNNSDIYLQLCM